MLTHDTPSIVLRRSRASLEYLGQNLEYAPYFFTNSLYVRDTRAEGVTVLGEGGGQNGLHLRDVIYECFFK